MWYPKAKRNPSPSDCYTAKRTKKIAICDHRTVGWIGYLRNFDHLKDGRRISAHFTVALDGSVQQHVDTDHIAWTQGIRKDKYGHARERWPLFQERNPNYDCIGIEHEDGTKLFTADNPMPPKALKATIDLHIWLFENVIEGAPELGTTIIPHDVLTPNRYNDPGEWLLNKIYDGIVAGREPEVLDDDTAARIAKLEAQVRALQTHTHPAPKLS